MSREVYSITEINSGGKWEMVPYYELSDGVYTPVQHMTGFGECVDALFGETPFDYPIDDDGNLIGGLEEPLDRIEELVDGLKCYGRLPYNASKGAKEYYDRFAYDIGESKSFPNTIAYSLRDLEMLELLSKITTPAASSFYNKYFAPIRWTLHAIKMARYVTNAADVRVIIWAY